MKYIILFKPYLHARISFLQYFHQFDALQYKFIVELFESKMEFNEKPICEEKIIRVCHRCNDRTDFFGCVVVPSAVSPDVLEVNRTESHLTSLCEQCYQQDRKNIIKQQRALNPVVYDVTCDACQQKRDCRFIRGFECHICDVCQDESDQLEIEYLVHQSKHLDIKNFEFPDKIINGVLYLGSKDSSIHEDFLLDLNIQQIIVCCNCLPMHFVSKKDFLSENCVEDNSKNKIRYLRIPVRDSLDQDILPYLQAAIDFIEEGKSQRQCATLVHCHAGISRSASVAIAYLIEMEEMSFEEAHGFVKSCRRNIYPNSGFVKQLQQFQELLQPSLQSQL